MDDLLALLVFENVLNIEYFQLIYFVRFGRSYLFHQSDKCPIFAINWPKEQLIAYFPFTYILIHSSSLMTDGNGGKVDCFLR